MTDKAERTDTERLDWLQHNEMTVFRVVHSELRQTTRSDKSPEEVLVFEGWTVHDETEPRQTIREAIDAAMREDVKDER